MMAVLNWLVFARLYNKASPDWKGAEGVKKLPCFEDFYFCGLFLLCKKLQLFYGAAVRRRNPEKPETLEIMLLLKNKKK
jgi:hypothetical protein